MLKYFNDSANLFLRLEVAVKYVAELREPQTSLRLVDRPNLDSLAIIPTKANGIILGLEDEKPDIHPESPFMSWQEVEREYILHILKKCQGNRERAAVILGVPLRRLNRKLREYERAGEPNL